MRRRGLAALTALVLVGAMAGTAQADFVANQGSFDGTGSIPGGAFVKPGPVGVNYADDSVVVVDQTGLETGLIDQFNLAGSPKPFASKGASNSITVAIGGRTEIAIDNSGTASDGNIYVISEGVRNNEGAVLLPGRVYGFDDAGNPLGGNWPLEELAEFGMCGISVDAGGDVWAAASSNSATEYTAAGLPTGKFAPAGGMCQHHFNSEGTFYGNFANGGAGFNGASIRVTYPKSGRREDLSEAKTARGFDLDLSTDNIIVNNAKYVVVINKSGDTIERFGEAEDFGTYAGLKDSYGLAYDPGSGKTYVSDSGATPRRVEIFGPHAPLPPLVSPGAIKQVRSSNAVIAASINPGGGATDYAIEYGLDTSYGSTAAPAPDVPVAGRKSLPVTVNLAGLTPGTRYHYRVVAENSTKRTEGADQTLVTYAPTPGIDNCPNALVRKQTAAAALADCRAYELASASDTAGYNVSSDLVPGESPLPGFPLASDPSKLLYTLESGSIPGTGTPTSFADDPYVATRGEDGWHTKYVGIPADVDGGSNPFASSFTAADDLLTTFAFAGPDLCDPCFADGKSGIPVRRADGSLVQGMAGSQDPGAGAQAHILVRKHLSADGSHLIFGSTEPFVAGAPPAGQPAIYSRDLDAGTTTLVSKTETGANIPCLSDCTTKGVAGLDVSADGSRVVVGKLVGTGPSGADLWRPYVNVAGASKSFDLAPKSTKGVLYYGMTDDGTKAFISSDEQLTGDDHDNSVDVFRADIDADGAELTRITTGSGLTGDSDLCDPVEDADHVRWNSLGAAASCDVVPVAGGAGLGRQDGSFYFLSPEQLDGAAGLDDAPNLYLAKPDGDVVFVATLDSILNTVADPVLRRRPAGEITGFTAPGQLALDKARGYLYVADSATDTVSRFDEDGTPAPFTFVAPYVSGNTLSGTPAKAFGLIGNSQLAIDESGGGSDGYLYVADREGSGEIDVFKASGEFAGNLSLGEYAGACGVATSPSGTIYALGELVYRYRANGADPATFVKEGPTFNLGGACLAASDSSNNLYAQFGEGGTVRKIKDGDWEAGNPFTTIADSATSLAGESGSDDYLIDRGNEIDQFHADGTNAVADSGQGVLIDSHGVVSVAGGSLYASDLGDGTVKIFTPIEPKPDPAIQSSPLVIHGLEEPDVQRTTDMQVEPSGGSAAFISSMPLNGDVVGQQRQIFRYDAGSATVDCVSCNLTRVVPVDGGRLAAFGSSLASKGRVFFNSAEPLVLRDANSKVDVYQWSKAGGVQLVSPGNSQFDNTLLTVSRDGTDAYFFTRNTLVAEDRNGELMKIYDARAGGGFLASAPRVPCAASDECHGAGTEPAPPLAINTVGDKTGKGANFKPAKKKCGKGKTLKKGKCVAKKPKKKKGKRGAGR